MPAVPHHLCEITDDELLDVLDPVNDPSFLNPDYTTPTKYLRPWFSIRIYYSLTDYCQFNWHYKAQSYEDELIFGGRGLFSFQLNDAHPQAFNLPFRPRRGFYCQVWDFDETEPLIDGFITNVIPVTEAKRRDGTPIQSLMIECEDVSAALELDTYNEYYQQKRPGFILRDAGTRAGLDVSEIDPNLGDPIDLPVNEAYPIDVYDQIMALIDMTYWVEPITKKVRVVQKDHADAMLMEILENNWDKVFDKDLDFRPDLDGYATRVIVEFLQKYNAGSANFQQNSDVVLGYSGDENWYLLPPDGDLTIENTLTGASYRVKRNNSDNTGTNELELEGQYKEVDATNVPYVIRGGRDKVRRTNTTAAQRLRQQGGGAKGSGIITRKVVLDVPLTRNEARTVAEAELAIASRDIVSGSGKTDNYRLQARNVRPGRTFFVDLLITKGLKATVRLESLRRRDIGGADRQRVDGLRIQKLAYEMEWTPSVNREQLRQLARKFIRTSGTSDQSQILDIEELQSIVAHKACATVIEPLTQLDPSIHEVEDSLEAREVAIKTYYFAPATTHPTAEAAFVGTTSFSNFS